MSAASELGRAREAFERRSWAGARDRYANADAAEPLPASELERWAACAHLTGDDDAFVRLLDRAHQAHLAEGRTDRAAFCAAWLGLSLAGRGDMAPAGGWFGRARRLLEDVAEPSVVEGYLVLADALRQAGSGEMEGALDLATRAQEIARRFGDNDLAVLSLYLMGRALLGQARVDEGMALLDEAMVAVASDRLSPHVPGIVYCSVISVLHAVYSVRRAQQWTEALVRWCERQPELTAYTGECRVNRSEILMLRGEWREAAAETEAAQERLGRGGPRAVMAEAEYQRAEYLRLRGDYAAAEAAYREAHRLGRQPHPGLALLRLAQGETVTAAQALRRVCRETTQPLKRARVLPACVEVLLAEGSPIEAHEAADELERIAATFGTRALQAIAAQAKGAVALVEGDAEAALLSLRQAWDAWRDLEAPYHVARVRLLLGRACAANGDDEAATLEFEAARATFDALGAVPDRALAEAQMRETSHGVHHGLTPREREVLRALTSGATNRVIADELGISERTVDRHVSNIYDKLGVASRSEATAYALRHHLV